MSDELTPLERAVLEAALAGESPTLEALREQLQSCRVKDRSSSTAGFFTHLEMAKSVPRAITKTVRVHIGDVEASIPGLRLPAGFLVFVENGYLDMLEGFTYDEDWPKVVENFELRYTSGETRRIDQLGL